MQKIALIVIRSYRVYTVRSDVVYNNTLHHSAIDILSINTASIVLAYQSSLVEI